MRYRNLQYRAFRFAWSKADLQGVKEISKQCHAAPPAGIDRVDQRLRSLTSGFDRRVRRFLVRDQRNLFGRQFVGRMGVTAAMEIRELSVLGA